MQTSGADTFPRLLAAALADQPGRPLVTAYDEATGERTELSVTTYANWVAKTANLLTEEYLLDPGEVVRVELPVHWLATVFLGAAWSADLTVTTDPGIEAALRVVGPPPEAAPETDVQADPQTDQGTGPAAAPGVATLACALLPFAVRFPDGPPAGTDDYGLLWPGQSDVFVAGQEPRGESVGWRDADGDRSQAEAIGAARTSAAGWTGTRLLTDVHPLADAGQTSFLAALVAGGSLVLVTHPRDDQWPARHEGERATDLLRS